MFSRIILILIYSNVLSILLRLKFTEIYPTCGFNVVLDILLFSNHRRWFPNPVAAATHAEGSEIVFGHERSIGTASSVSCCGERSVQACEASWIWWTWCFSRVYKSQVLTLHTLRVVTELLLHRIYCDTWRYFPPSSEEKKERESVVRTLTRYSTWSTTLRYINTIRFVRTSIRFYGIYKMHFK